MSRILIVDDDPQVVAGLQEFLALENIKTVGVLDRDGAEELLESEYFPLVLADVRLRSEADGLQLLESIRRISPRSRVASMTGSLNVDEDRLRALGASVILHKPFPIEEIVAIIRELLAEIERIEKELSVDSAVSVEEIYRVSRRVMYSIPQRRYGLSSEDAEELVQEAWCIFLEQRATIRNPKTWLTGTVANLCRRAIQERYRQRARDERQPEPETSVNAVSDAGLIVRQALDRLDDRSRALCELIGMEQRSYDEVSAAMGIPLGSVGPLYIRAKSKLRHLVSGD
jgi:RNA polymerase sigma factor (sigma-70 family)